MARTFVLIPPLKRVSGGLAVLYRLALALTRGGFAVALTPLEPGLVPMGAPPGAERLPTVPAAAADPGPGDVWLVPEGWPSALEPGRSAGAHVTVYCQNWSYLFPGLFAVPDPSSLHLHFLAVSAPVAWFLKWRLGVSAPVLRPGIDLSVFHPPAQKPRDRLRLAFMPRKNKALAQAVKDICQAATLTGGPALEWTAIEGLGPAQVAEALRSSHIYLHTGFPEGCPLPPLEAMACGCLPVGFAGLGGWDYMRQAEAGGFVPDTPLEPLPWGGNGIFVPDADVAGAVRAVERACALWREGGNVLEAVLAAGRETARAYGLDAFERRVCRLWREAFWTGAAWRFPGRG